MIVEVSFGSTYRIPLKQAGINGAKKERLREFITNKFTNSLVSADNNNGTARISVPQENDEFVERSIKSMGFKVFQKFDLQNINKFNMDAEIKKLLDARSYSQKGKQISTKRK